MGYDPLVCCVCGAVGGTIIGGVSPTQGSAYAKRKNGERGKDGQKRSLWHCKLCVQHKKCDDDAVKCIGSQAAGNKKKKQSYSTFGSRCRLVFKGMVSICCHYDEISMHLLLFQCPHI